MVYKYKYDLLNNQESNKNCIFHIVFNSYYKKYGNLNPRGLNHRVSTDREALPCTLYSLACVAGLYLIKCCKENLSYTVKYPLRLTQLFSPFARCNVHNECPSPGLIKFSSLGRPV